MNYPARLFKYQKFKSYSKGMLETGYIYFSPIEQLDDPLELSVSISNKIVEGNQKEYVKELVPFILKQLFINGSNKKFKRINIDKMYDNEGNFLEDRFKLYIKATDSSIGTGAIDNVINLIKQIPKELNEKQELKDALKKIIDIKKLVGVYSLTEINNNQLLWDTYANHYEGFCIEYDMDKFFKENQSFIKELFQVKYSNTRENDPIKLILNAFIYGCSGNSVNNFITEKITDIVRTKKTDYAYQKEWRLVGVPKDTSLCLPIINIYLGYRIKERNKRIILKIAKDKGYGVYQQQINNETVDLEYRKIL